MDFCTGTYKVFLRLRKQLTTFLSAVLIVAVALLVLVVVWGVFTRYVMGEQAKWSEELARFILIWVSMLGGAVAFGTKGHLGVDYFVELLDRDARRLAEIVVHAVVLFFALSIFIWGGGNLVLDNLAMEQMTPALGWKMGYIYMAVPVAGFFMVIYSVENLIETLISNGHGSALETEKKAG